MPKEYTPQEILTLPLGENDAKASTVGEYLARLTTKLLFKQEAFDPEEPFGNPGWIEDLIHPLILNGYIDGELDESGSVMDYDETGFKTLLHMVTLFLREADYSTLTLPPEPKDWFVLEIDVTDPKNPVIATQIEDAMTESEAKSHEHPRQAGADPREFYITRAVHIPSVS